MIEFAVFLIISLLLVSFAEYSIHRWFMHNKTWFKDLYHKHTVLHHGKFFKVFNYEKDPVGRHINIKFNFWENAILTISVAAVFAYFSIIGCITLIVVSLLHFWAWNTFHNEMHNPSPINRRAFFKNTWFYNFLSRYHWIHHKYRNRNFNVVLPFWDFVFFTYRKPSQEEKLSMAIMRI